MLILLLGLKSNTIKKSSTKVTFEVTKVTKEMKKSSMGWSGGRAFQGAKQSTDAEVRVNSVDLEFL